MQKIDLLCTALQWFGFIAIAVGTYYVGPNPFRAAAWFVPGAAALTGWCLLQEPVPFGILGVQIVCGGFSALNVYRLWPTRRRPAIVSNDGRIGTIERAELTSEGLVVTARLDPGIDPEKWVGKPVRDYSLSASGGQDKPGGSSPGVSI